MQSIVICAFSGTGKTLLADNESTVAKEVDATDCPNTAEGVTYYLDSAEIIIKSGVYQYVLLSCRRDIREELSHRSIPYVIVMPRKEDLNEYMQRWLRRGTPTKLLASLQDNWHIYLTSCVNDTAPKIYLERDQWLKDVLKLYTGMSQITEGLNHGA